MKNTTVFILLLVAGLFSTGLLGAEEEADPSGRELTLQLSSIPEAKFIFTQNFIIPFLQGSNPLTEDNNIMFKLSAELSPVSLNGLAETIWTPAAFFQFAAGGRIGSGWNISLFGSDIKGIGINRDRGDSYAEHSGSAFDGLLWKVQLGAVLQFDLAALFPGDWNHVVAKSYHEINYSAYTAASSGDSWYYENDEGENVNGFNYYGNLFVGYQMPIILDTVGLLAEAGLYLYDTPGRSAWGDDRIRWAFSVLGNFTFNKKFSTALLVQFRTERNYTESDWEDLYYRNRHIDTSKPLRLVFYRVVLAVNYKL